MEKLNPDWLKQLAPAHPPVAPGWWPLAPGWWMVMFGLIVVASILIYRHRRISSILRRTALRELEKLHTGLSDEAQFAGALQNLLRRYAIAIYGHAAVANLSGREWLSFLAAHGGKEFAGEDGLSLLRSAYGGCSTPSREQWLKGANGFLRGRN